MVISVLERRGEIGVRRALGARAVHIAGQFLVEAAVLATLGGLGGAVSAPPSPRSTPAAGLARRRAGRGRSPPAPALALAVGLLAGVSPAVRAARLDPAEAIRPS